MKSVLCICCSLDKLSDRWCPFSPCPVGFISPNLVSPMNSSYGDRVCLVIFLKLLVLFPKDDILLLEVLHLLGVLLLKCVHFPLQGDYQSMIIKHLTYNVHLGCGTPIFRGSCGRHPKCGGHLSLGWSFLVGCGGLFAICFHWWWSKENFSLVPQWAPNVFTKYGRIFWCQWSSKNSSTNGGECTYNDILMLKLATHR